MKIKVLGAGGNAGMGMVRCLSEAFEVVGEDDSPYAKYLMECPLGDAEFVVPVPSSMVKRYCGKQRKGLKLFLPALAQVSLAQDKYQCAVILAELAPKTYWVRDTHGSGGKGAQMCQEFCPGRNYSVELVFVGGKLIAQFTKERLSYTTKGYDQPLERRGTSMVSVCLVRPDLVEKAVEGVRRIAAATKTIANGFYGVDFMEDENGEAKITEINAGRLLTASYIYFYNGYNLPVAGIKALLGEPYELGPYPEGIGVVRGYDRLPYVGRL